MNTWPVIAIVGRPNVGKSTLYNCLAQRRDALVFDEPGVTKDRQYAEISLEDKPFILIDTGGLIDDADHPFSQVIREQTNTAISESDLVLFLVDAQAGLTPDDREIAQYLRNQAKNVLVVINKIDGLDSNVVGTDFWDLGFEHLILIAASQRRGIQKLAHAIAERFPAADISFETTDEDTSRVKVAIVGRPNVGKSTLINRILGESRMIVSEHAGTTTDSISVPFEYQNIAYTLIDTAGVRRRGRVVETLEKFSVVKTLQAIEACDVTVLLLDATEGVVGQDLSLLTFIMDAGKACVIAMNKWDDLDAEKRDEITVHMEYKLRFMNQPVIHNISAKQGRGIGELFKSIQQVYAAACTRVSTSELTELLQQATRAKQPPLHQGRRIKLKYAHMGGIKPPCIVIHGNQVLDLPESYRKYLLTFFRKGLKLFGTPVTLEFRTNNNPYKERRNLLTKRQLKKRERIRKS